jgi:hypothetical protein
VSLFEDFCIFARAQLSSGDIDPTYPVLKKFYADAGIAREVGLWRTLLYLTWYSIGSAETVWTACPEPVLLRDESVRGLSTGVERRGFRGNARAAKFVNAVLDRAGHNLSDWVSGLGEGERGWDRCRAEIEAVSFAGPWASYKWADLLKHVHDVPITASDIGVGGGGEKAGPIPGMVRLTGHSWKECATNRELQKTLLKRAQDAGVPFDGLDQLETALCDFNSLVKGSYFVGHDIDDQQTKLPVHNRLLWMARSVFPDRYRGELNGWFGVRKHLNRKYADEGVIVL